MKKPKEQEDCWAPTWLLTGLLLIVIVMIIWGLYTCFNKPEFRITKQECWNETTDKHLRVYEDFITTTCPGEISSPTEVPCYDSKGNIIIGEKCLKDKGYKCYKSRLAIFNDSILVAVSEISGVTQFNWYSLKDFTPSPEYFAQFVVYPNEGVFTNGLPTYQVTEQKCEDKEVEEIVYDKSSGYNNCPGTEYNPLCDSIGKITKQHLTEPWLQENCECIEKSCDCGLGKRVCADKENKKACQKADLCLKYKCGDYQVEVK